MLNTFLINIELLKSIKIEEQKIAEDLIQKRVGGTIILNNKNEILLLKRVSNDFMPNITELPSGNIEKDEDFLEGTIREVKEETNLDIKEFVKVIDTFDYISGSGKKARQINFLVKINDINLAKFCPEEHQAMYWVNYQDFNLMKQLGVTDLVINTINKIKL